VGLCIGIVGCGKVAQSSYLPFLSQQKDLQLLYYSRTPDKAAACAQRFGGRAVDSPDALAAASPDAVLVLTRETQRAEAISALLETKGIPRLFFEKPLVAARGQQDVTVEDFSVARDLLRRAQAQQVQTAMVFNYRFFERVQMARRIVAEREFGAVQQVVAFSHYDTWSHVIDLMQTFAGPLDTIAALSNTPQSGDPNVLDVAAALRFQRGATGTILGTASLCKRFPYFELSIAFAEGRVHLRDLDGDLEVLDYRRTTHERHSPWLNQSRWDYYGASFKASLAAYLDSIRKGEPAPVSGRAGLEELQFEAALKCSISEKRPVNVQCEFPLE
jgi:predicted dehydrogenase